MEGKRTVAVGLDPLLRSLIRELRTPLLEVSMASKLGQGQDVSLLAEHALQVYDSYLLLQETIDAGELDLQPCSLISETGDVLKSISPLSDFYNVQIELKIVQMRVGVALNRQVFRAALHASLYSIITSLQNTSEAVVQITINGKNGPNLSIFSSDIKILPEDIMMTKVQGSKIQPSPMVEGSVAGLAIAGGLLEAMGTKLEATSNQYGKGFHAVFRHSRQMSIIEAKQS